MKDRQKERKHRQKKRQKRKTQKDGKEKTETEKERWTDRIIMNKHQVACILKPHA